MPERPEALRKGSRLRKRRQFLAVQGEGKKLQSRSFLVFVRPQADAAGPTRLGITVSRKIGSAVERNHVKRLVREVFRRHKALFPRGVDVVFVAKRAAPELSYEQARAEVEGLCERYFQR